MYLIISLTELIKLLEKEDLYSVCNTSRMDRNKAREISNKCISQVIKQNIEKKMDENYYHLIIDEVSDRYGSGYLGISIKFIGDSGPKTRLYKLINLENDCSSENIYKIIKDMILISDLRKKNLIGLITDGASTMCGINERMATKIARDVDHLFWLHCTSHCLNLILENACEHIISLKLITCIISNTIRKISYTIAIS